MSFIEGDEGAVEKVSFEKWFYVQGMTDEQTGKDEDTYCLKILLAVASLNKYLISIERGY